MPILDVKQREEVKKRLQDLQNPVKIVVFTQALDCQYCSETKTLVGEVASLSDKTQVEAYNFALDKGKVEEYKVDKVPAIAIVGDTDYGARYYGISAGLEFAAFLEDIRLVSTRTSDLSEDTKRVLAEIDSPVHLQVFITPTCPWCPRVVVLAHRLAMESDYIRTDIIEAQEFPALSMRYQVYSVPKTIINDGFYIEGAMPEPLFVRGILQGVKKNIPEGAEMPTGESSPVQ